MWGGRPWAQPVRGLRESVPTDGREGRGDGGEVGSQCRLWGALKKPEVEAWSGAGGPAAGGSGRMASGEDGLPLPGWGCVYGLRSGSRQGSRGSAGPEQLKPQARFASGGGGPVGDFWVEMWGCHLSCGCRTGACWTCGPRVPRGPSPGSVGGAGRGQSRWGPEDHPELWGEPRAEAG